MIILDVDGDGETMATVSNAHWTASVPSLALFLNARQAQSGQTDDVKLAEDARRVLGMQEE